MRFYLDKIYNYSGWAAACFIAAICAVVVVQVMLNILDRLSTIFTGEAIGLTIPSYSDFTGFFLAAASFLALAYCLKEGSHIRVSFVLQMFSKKVQRFFEIWCLLISSAMACFFTFYTAALVHESFVYNDLSAGMVAIPIWIPMMPMLIGLMVLAIALIDELIQVIRGRSPSYADKGENLLLDESKPIQVK